MSLRKGWTPSWTNTKPANKAVRKLTHPDHLVEWKREILEQKPAYQKTVVVTSGTCGQASGSLAVVEALREEIEKRGLAGTVGIEVTGCHGFCEMEPNIVIYPEGIFYKKLEPRDIPSIVEKTILKDKIISALSYEDPATGRRFPRQKEIPFYQKQMRLLTENNFLINPERIEDYISLDGYQALSKALFDMTSDGVIKEITASGLRGRGGAGFLTGKKWDITREAQGHPKYIICNADEGDPGAYMDRSLLEGNPHSVIEGMIIGAYAIGSSEGFIYVRMEYPLAVEHVTKALERARRHGLLGQNILGSEFHFDIQIVQGAGAFVSGEETSLMASIEGRKAYPRQRPPFPSQEGLWGKPTNINNVETWANVPLIITRGADWFAKIGTEKSKGTKIFSLVGKINNTGLVEVPMGITLREIIYDVGGGIKNDKAFKAVQTGGPSGGCIPAEKIDLPIDYDSLAQAGSIMGSGGMIVMDQDTCMVDIARYFLNFTREESCGKCVPCRVGTRQMHATLTRITRGEGEEEDFQRLEDLAATMKTASLCGLGQTAANPVISTLRYFRNEYEDHIRKKRCPALVCRELVSSPCHYICPIGQEASTYIALVAWGRYREAFDVIMKDNPLPSVCGRVCHHPCEKVCRAGESGDPISIRALKRFVMDWAEREGIRFEPKPVEQRRERIAVIGAGPAGLTAAYYLAFKGFRPTIFEALPVAGGMLGAAIPEHRLPRKILNRDIEVIKKTGVEIKTGVRLGRDLTIDSLFRDGYKAVFVATGAWKSMKMGAHGEEAEGVLQSLEYLKNFNLGGEARVGTHVCVVGGGNSAIDAARVAIRDKNCEKVTILYRRTRAEMPAFPEEVGAAIEEGVDIKFLVAPVKVLAKSGRVVGVECIRMELGDKDASGRRRPVPIPGSEFSIELDTLILAIGERPETGYISAKDGIETRRGENIVADAETFMTSRKGVFAGGDAVTGPNTVVDSMGAGKRAAEAIEKYLEGKPLERTYELTRPSRWIAPVELREDEIGEAKRPAMPHLPAGQRKKNFKEVELGLGEAAACAEARRCLRCELETRDGQDALDRMKARAEQPAETGESGT
jgi:NADH-quinone oxidoreductase subunit F